MSKSDTSKDYDTAKFLAVVLPDDDSVSKTPKEVKEKTFMSHLDFDMDSYALNLKFGSLACRTLFPLMTIMCLIRTNVPVLSSCNLSLGLKIAGLHPRRVGALGNAGSNIG